MRLLACALCAASLLRAHDPISTRLTWTQEISRIIFKRCIACHKTGPISFVTYDSARPWAKAIKDEVLNRRMPPWGAVKGFGDFRDDPSLTQDEITRIAEWVEGGAPEGDPAYLPPVPKSSSKTEIPRGRLTKEFEPPLTLLGIRPLASAQSAEVTAKLPDGSIVPLLWLRDYKRDWNRTFVYREPMKFPEGTRISAVPAYPFEFLVR
jgi:hypothetical protein